MSIRFDIRDPNHLGELLETLRKFKPRGKLTIDCTLHAPYAGITFAKDEKSFCGWKEAETWLLKYIDEQIAEGRSTVRHIKRFSSRSEI